MNEAALVELLRDTVPPAPKAVNGNGHSIQAVKEDSSFPESSKGRFALPFRPLSEVVNVPAEPEWLVRGLIPKGGLVVLAAKPKDGKSTLVCAMLAALERGEPFLGLETARCQALLLTEERSRTLAEKRQRWRIEPMVLMRHEIGDTEWSNVVAEAVRCCHEKGLGLLVVDTLAEWGQLFGDAENSAGAVLDLMRPLQDAAASGLTVIVVHHLRKGSAEDGDSLRGSGAIRGAVDVIVRLSKPKAQSLSGAAFPGRIPRSRLEEGAPWTWGSRTSGRS